MNVSIAFHIFYISLLLVLLFPLLNLGPQDGQPVISSSSRLSGPATSLRRTSKPRTPAVIESTSLISVPRHTLAGFAWLDGLKQESFSASGNLIGALSLSQEDIDVMNAALRSAMDQLQELEQRVMVSRPADGRAHYYIPVIPHGHAVRRQLLDLVSNQIGPDKTAVFEQTIDNQLHYFGVKERWLTFSENGTLMVYYRDIDDTLIRAYSTHVNGLYPYISPPDLTDINDD